MLSIIKNKLITLEWLCQRREQRPFTSAATRFLLFRILFIFYDSLFSPFIAIKGFARPVLDSYWRRNIDRWIISLLKLRTRWLHCWRMFYEKTRKWPRSGPGIITRMFYALTKQVHDRSQWLRRHFRPKFINKLRQKRRILTTKPRIFMSNKFVIKPTLITFEW